MRETIPTRTAWRAWTSYYNKRSPCCKCSFGWKRENVYGLVGTWHNLLRRRRRPFETFLPPIKMRVWSEPFDIDHHAPHISQNFLYHFILSLSLSLSLWRHCRTLLLKVLHILGYNYDNLAERISLSTGCLLCSLHLVIKLSPELYIVTKLSEGLCI